MLVGVLQRTSKISKFEVKRLEGFVPMGIKIKIKIKNSVQLVQSIAAAIARFVLKELA